SCSPVVVDRGRRRRRWRPVPTSSTVPTGTVAVVSASTTATSAAETGAPGTVRTPTEAGTLTSPRGWKPNSTGRPHAGVGIDDRRRLSVPIRTAGGHRRRFRDFGREPPPDARHWW